MELNKIYNMDCLEGLKQISNNSVDCIITDPPYGISYRSNSGGNEYKERIQRTEWDKDFEFVKYFEELYRVLKDNSFMYVFGRFENYETMNRLGLKRVLIWDKLYPGMGDLEDWGIAYELVYVFKKGKPKLRGKRINGVFSIQHIGFFDKTVHPTQKPVKVIRLLIEKSTNENSIVLDAFMGSGTTALACKQLNRQFIGFELDKGYCDIANNRLRQEGIKKWM